MSQNPANLALRFALLSTVACLRRKHHRKGAERA
jgi:hypothetical protein